MFDITIKMPQLDELVELQRKQVELLAKIARRLPVARPARAFLRVISETGADDSMAADILTFNVVLPRISRDSDVVRRRVEMQDVPSVTVECEQDPDDPAFFKAQDVGPFQGRQGEQVRFTVVNIDDADGESSADFDQTLTDTLPPPTPENAGLRVTGERESADEPLPPPDVQPDPPVV